MDTVTAKLTVYFEEPFWVGVYERVTEGKLEVSKVVFGAEPKDYEVYQFFLSNFTRLHFSQPVVESVEKKGKQNPKRMQRAIKSQLRETGIGTKAQQALKLQREQMKLERKVTCRKKTEEEKRKQYACQQQKRKEKHKGR